MLLAVGLDPDVSHAVRAEPRRRARRAGLDAGVHGASASCSRMTQFKDKSGASTGEFVSGRAVHLPGADGRRHPALRHRRGAGRRRPAPARRAHPRPRRSASTTASARRSWCPRRVIPTAGARVMDLQEPDAQDVEVGRLAAGHGAGARRRPTSSSASSGGRSPTPTPRCATTWPQKPGVSNLLVDPGRLHRASTRGARRAVHAVRPAQGGHRRGRGRVACARSRSATQSSRPTPARSTELLRQGREQGPRRRLGDLRPLARRRHRPARALSRSARIGRSQSPPNRPVSTSSDVNRRRLLEGVREVVRDGPRRLRADGARGPRDREGVAAGEGEEVRAELGVTRVQPDLAGEATRRGPVLRCGPSRRSTRERRDHPADTRRAPASIFPPSWSSAAASTGRPASWPSARSTRRATAIEWRRSALLICCQSSRSPGSI